MSRGNHVDVSTELLEVVTRPHILCQIDFPSGVVNFWTGQTSLVWDSKTWQGTGRAIGFSQITETTDGSSQGVSIDISGIDPDDVSDVVDDEFQDSDCQIWLVMLSEAGAVIGSPIKLFNGKLDSGELNETGDTSTIELKAESRLIAQIKKIPERYTDSEQQARFPGDRGLEFIAGIQDKKIVWQS